MSYGSLGQDHLPLLIKRVRCISIKDAAAFTQHHKRHSHLVRPAQARIYALLASYSVNKSSALRKSTRRTEYAVQ